MNEAEVILDATVQRLYDSTRTRFETLAENERYRQYVVPASTAPAVGFAIFYTPYRFSPELVIAGQNPSNFSGRNSPLTAPPNRDMLSGIRPTKSSYVEHEHLFASALGEAFEIIPELLADAVGMNVWHFQCVSEAEKAPKDLIEFCENNSERLVDSLSPRNVLCLGRVPWKALTRRDRGERVPDTKYAESVRIGDTTYYFTWHPTGSHDQRGAKDDLMLLADRIAD
jgi:hypothetical protein